MKCDVIVTYCWNRVGYNILRSLTRQGLSVVVGDTSNKNICSLSKYVSGNFVYPDPFTNEDEFISCIIAKVQELSPKVLLPTHDESIIIAKHRNYFPLDLIIPIDHYDNLVSLSNKITATNLAQKANIPVPRIFKHISEITKFPVVYKTAIGNSAKGVYFPKNIDDLNVIAAKNSDKETFIQEKVNGTDHSVDCIRYGHFFFALTYKALVTKTDGGGTTTQRIIVDCPQLIEYSKLLLDYVDYNGVCGLDFKCDDMGRAYFIECNTRYTGGLATPITAGFDIPYIHYCISTKGKYDKEIEIKFGTKTKWILGDIITFIGRLISFKLKKAEIQQIFNFKFDAFDDYRKDDKKAIIGEMIYYFNKLVKNRKLNP